MWFGAIINTYSFSTAHTFVLPLLTAVFMLMHLMIRKQGISGPLKSSS
jgi:quinol-cytochrome oxidoreductase complex cytochrome b subunit